MPNSVLLLLALSLSVLLAVAKHSSSSSGANPYANPCSFARFEEDIAVENSASKRIERAAISLKRRLWSKGVIPYEISNSYSREETGLIMRAIVHWERNTCLTFAPRSESDSDFIHFEKTDCVCCSFVGRKGGKQGISLPNKCLVFGTIVHEIGHAIGFYHEHTRPDRDKYVKIKWENIADGRSHNFDMTDSYLINSLGEPYDYKSIMHYGRYTFSKDGGNTTIRTKNLKFLQQIGQREALSKGDIRQTKKLYSCLKCGKILTAKSGIFTSPDYPRKYPINKVCSWKIIAATGIEIRLNVTSFRMQSRSEKSGTCKNDYLEIWDRVGGKLLGKYCDKDMIPVVKSLRTLYVKFVSDSSLVFKGFSASYEAVCGGRVHGSSGYLASPNYPDEYFDDMNCTWTIVGLSANISIEWDFLNIEMSRNCLYDYVEFLSETSKSYRRLCGTTEESDVAQYNFVTSGNSITVRFVTDESHRRQGFRFQWISDIDECSVNNGGCEQICTNTQGSFVCSCSLGFLLNDDGRSCKKDCGGVLTASTGVIQSPFHPKEYPLNKRCDWRVSFPSTYFVTLTFESFDVEKDERCAYDKLIITGATNRYVYCGKLDAGKQLTFRGAVNITFISDETVSEDGFSILYRAVDVDECLLPHTCSQICNNTEGSFFCSCKAGYRLTSDGRTCEDIDECSEGESSCEHYCNNTEGGYFCTCKTGYILNEDGLNCTDIDECSEGESSCEHYCNNTEGGYFCTCKTGYILNEDGLNCTDIDECVNGSNDCQVSCLNAIGGYKCSCSNKNLFLEPNGRNCTKCSGLLTYSPSGELIIPTGAQSTELGLECLWKMRARTGHYWQFQFNEINCRNANISLLVKSHSKLWSNSCNNVSEEKIYSFFSNALEFKLSATKNSSLGPIKIGFETACGGSLFAVERNRTLYSHYNFNGRATMYKPNATCIWTITNPKWPSKKTVLRFVSFSLRESENCTTDYLEIDNQRHCGNHDGITVSGDAKVLTLKFHSAADSEGDKGFKITYRRVRM